MREVGFWLIFIAFWVYGWALSLLFNWLGAESEGAAIAGFMSAVMTVAGTCWAVDSLWAQRELRRHLDEMIEAETAKETLK